MDISDFRVRKVLPSDMEQVYLFICELENRILDKVIFREYFFRNISLEDNVYLLGCYSEIPAGFLSCHCQTLLHHSGPVYEIQELYVAGNYRNKGLGTLLAVHLKQELAAKGISSLEVSSNKNRTDAHRFYMKSGFTKSHFKFTMKNL